MRVGNGVIRTWARGGMRQGPILFWHSMRITHQVIPIYDITVHENKIDVVLNVAKTVGAVGY